MDPTRKLYRSTSDRKLVGGCVSAWLRLQRRRDPDPVLFVLLAVLGGSGLVLYLAMWIIVPKQP